MRVNFKIGHRPTLPRFTAVPSALAGLTSLFGMGRGRHRRYRHLNFFVDLLISLLVDWYLLTYNSIHKRYFNMLRLILFIRLISTNN